MKIPHEILAILDNCRVEGNTVFLPPEQLDRKTYTAVNKCLENIGGKWNRKAKGHVFDGDPEEALSVLVSDGEFEDTKKVYQFFPTPREVAERMCEMAELDDGCCVLEPSIGKGDLADVVCEYCGKNSWTFSIFGVELNRGMESDLSNKPYTSITGVDFLEFAKEVQEGKIKRNFTHVIMNPPFSKQQDIAHIRAAFDLLLPGGVLVSVASTSWRHRQDKKAAAFREWLGEMESRLGVDYVEIEDVPVGAFKESGTMISTVIIKIRCEGEFACNLQKAPAVALPPRLTFAEKFRLSKAS